MFTHTKQIVRTLFIVTGFSFLYCSCSTEIKPKRSFCSWKTTFPNEWEDDTIFSKLEIDHIYLRFFDVDWNPYMGEGLPVATLNYLSLSGRDSMEITPSVFITNNVMLYSSKKQLDSLAVNIKNRVDTLIKEFGINNYINSLNYNYNGTAEYLDSIDLVCELKFRQQIKEIMIDCDWTEKSRDNYFYFLEELQEHFKSTPVSATIRLWQYKYHERAGIPPVDRGLLMCYNLESSKEYQVENSISSAWELEKYLTGKKYPLKLDIALPIFSWAVLFRAGEFKGIINDLTIENCKQDTLQYAQISENRFVFKNDQVSGDTYIRSGDEIRIEKVSTEELEKIAQLLIDKKIVSTKSRITFFSFDRTYINDYGIENIDKIYSLFNN